VSPGAEATGSSRRRARKLALKSPQPADAKRRERLLDATAELVAGNTYTTTTVAQISKLAGVSSATFYALYGDKESCFLAAYRRVAQELLGEIESRADAADPSTAWQTTLDGIIELAAGQPHLILLLADEAKLSTRHALEARDRLVVDIEATIERRRQRPSAPAAPDIPAKVLVGATLRLLISRLRRENSALEELRDGLIGWIKAYRSSGTPRWQALTPTAGIQPGPPNYAGGLAPPQRPSRGRTRLTLEQASHNQRERILHATAEVTAENGYAESTVADIVARAGLAREVFYRHFRDKQEAFISAYETGFQSLMALAVGAFYTSSDWPERIWAALRAYADFMVNFPTFAHLGMVESHTISPEMVERLDERVMAFTVFLQDGREMQEEPERSLVLSEAIAMAIYEITSHTLRHGRNKDMPGLVPLMTYIALAPFTGADAACEFVDRKVREARRSADEHL
jgi:AcrR family transcriptional regulator